ncbi:MAG: hypothetical protein U9Q68_10585 [Euryarchaeota archaeon]|nr:hypothetical protein [Euryarchaeota archaeon]
MQTTEIYDEALDEALCAMECLCADIDERQDEIDRYFDPESDLNFKKRSSSVKERLIELGEVVVELLAEYLYAVDSHSCIIAADVLGRIGSPAAIPGLIDAIEADLDDLCEDASKALVKIGTPAVQPLIDRINDRMDNPELDKYGREIGTIYAIGTLSRIQDPRSFNFMVELLDRSEDATYPVAMDYLCGCFYDQHNLEIVPRLKEIAEEYKDASGKSNHISAEAEYVLAHFKIDQALESEYWVIHGCCHICENYDPVESICGISDEYEPRDAFCTGCEPKAAFDCDMCYSNDCDIYNLPPVYVDLKYRRDQKESVDEFEITNTRHDSDTGSISIKNDCTELILDSSSVETLNELKEFLEWEVCDTYSFSTGVSLSVDYGDAVCGKLVRNGDCVVAICDEQGPGAELESKLEMAVELEFDPDAIDELIAVIDTQRFLLLCDSYRLLDKSREQQKDFDLRIGDLAELLEGIITSVGAKKPEPEPALGCDHEFELLKEHKKYTVYRCVKCGKTRKEFG